MKTIIILCLLFAIGCVPEPSNTPTHPHRSPKIDRWL